MIARLRWVSLIVCLAWPGVSSAHEKLTFAFAQNAPPYSFEQDSSVTGVLPELVHLVFQSVPGYAAELTLMPWSRAQLNVRQGQADGFLTYPSAERKRYALFSEKPLFTQDFGYLVYSANNPNAGRIESAESFSDLAGLKVIVEMGSKWEEENIPSDLERVPGRDVDTMVHLLMLRKAGDFMVQPAEDARFVGQKLGYADNLRIRKVDFIPNARVPFHLGISKAHSEAAEIIERVDDALQQSDFLRQRDSLIKGYR